MFENIDNYHVAYLLGRIASSADISLKRIKIKTTKERSKVLYDLYWNLKDKTSITIFEDSHCELILTSLQDIENILFVLNIGIFYRQKMIIPKTIIKNNLIYQYLLGYFDGNGKIYVKNKELYCELVVNSENMRNEIKELFNNIFCIVKFNKLVWKNMNVVKFIGKLYSNSEVFDNLNYESFSSISTN